MHSTVSDPAGLRAEIARRIASLDRDEGIELDDASLDGFFNTIEAEVLSDFAAGENSGSMAATDN